MRIRSLREARSLSVRELARRSGLPPESVSRSERGITEITLTNLSRLCEGLRIDLPVFFDFAKKIPPDELSPEARRILDLVTDLPANRRRSVMRGLELLLVGDERGPAKAPSRVRP